MMFCKKCGKEIGEGARFCVACGTAVEAEASVATAVSVDQAPASEVYEEIEAPVTIKENPVEDDGQAAEPANEPVVQAVEEPKFEEEAQTVAAPVYEVPEHKDVPKKKKNKFVSGLLGGISVFLIFVVLLGGILLLTVRSIIGSENITETYKNIDDSVVEDIIKETTLLSKNKEKNDIIAKEIAKESTIPNFVVKKIGEYGDYILGGEEPSEVKETDIVKLLQKNQNVASLLVDEPDYYYYYYYDRDEEYAKFFQNNVEPDLSKFYGDETIDKAMDIARIFMSVWFLIGFGVILLLLLFMNIMTRTKKLASLTWLGCTFIVTGGIYMFAYLAARFLRPVVLVATENINEVLNAVIGSVMPEAILFGGGAIVAGVLMLGAKSLIKKIAAKRA